MQMKGIIDRFAQVLTTVSQFVSSYNLWLPYNNISFCQIRWIGPIKQGLLKKVNYFDEFLVAAL